MKDKLKWIFNGSFFKIFKYVHQERFHVPIYICTAILEYHLCLWLNYQVAIPTPLFVDVSYLKARWSLEWVTFWLSAMLWTSPELLRDNSAHRNGTQKGDVYSFAIVLQEIIYRCGPYEATGQLPMVPKGEHC